MNRQGTWEADADAREGLLCDSPEEKALAKIAKDSSEKAAAAIREIFKRPSASADGKSKKEVNLK